MLSKIFKINLDRNSLQKQFYKFFPIKQLTLKKKIEIKNIKQI